MDEAGDGVMKAEKHGRLRLGFFHRLSHWLKWNEVKPFGNGYICALCGEFTKYDEPRR